MLITIFENFFLTPKILKEWFQGIQVEVYPLKHQKISYLQNSKSDLVLLHESISVDTKENLPYLLAITPSCLDPDIDWIPSSLSMEEIQKRLRLVLAYLHEKKKCKIYEENFHFFADWAVVGKIALGTVHELNNPLQVMLGFVEEIEDRISEGIECNEAVSLLKDEIYRCCNIVKNLQFSNNLQPSEYEDIEILLDNILSLMQYQIHKRKITIVKEISKDIPFVDGSPKIKTILLGFLAEALENSKIKEKVFLNVSQSSQHIVVSIHFSSSSEKIVQIFPFFMEKLLQTTGINFKHTTNKTSHAYILEFSKIS
ncbi:MAG: HAMP domain-containing histidine kinase [Candidatus Brocadiae bacterium]|nr:HAMP domain-containing histidine kinase [Candidatus Brocadiia bacterium]